MLSLLAQLRDENLISELNYQFAKLIDHKQQAYHYSPQQQNLAILLSALVSFNVMQGHSCVRLNSLTAQNPFGLTGKHQHLAMQILQKIDGISPLAWQRLLQDHIAFSVDSRQAAPMLFQGDRLYFYRYWQAENQIANSLLQAVRSDENFANPALHKQILDYFFLAATETIDWQKVAVATALQQKFCLISGGPGTGKTRTVAILLAALQLKQLKLQQPLLHIALAAPTGKAAARLKESITDNLAKLALPESLKNAVPNQASTIHSLIGIIPNCDTPKHHRRNPLHIDLLVIDEASMIDLFVMQKLLDALKPSTRVIMLGDKDQLASVEAGSIMSELGCFLTYGYSPAHSQYLTETTGFSILPVQQKVPPICDSLCHLRHSYRFDKNSGIGQLAAEINDQQAVRSWQTFANSAFSDLTLYEYPAQTYFADPYQHQQYCVNLVVEKALALYRPYFELVKKRAKAPHSVSVEQIFTAFQQVRFLSALRVGELGVERLNQTIAEALLQAGLVQFRHSRDSYLGKPILITENAPQLHIFSGDIGIILPDEQGKIRVYFESEQDGKTHSLSASRIPNFEPAYVMTVHKSQGSEFVHTLLVTPLTISPVVTKELLYTAVTRAKQQFTLFGDEKSWKQGVKSEVQRQSGLSEQLLAF
ncbi:exodeoxyribonuclease V subunit alpha [Pasteurellaceae bacterium Orientalotternb1]|nr:exodeoxyribonuclease V subunit alpha [Pasteurellaceae bacterium Orientalotternb1]